MAAKVLKRWAGLTAGLAFLFPAPARAIHFPDTLELKKTWKVVDRKDGRIQGFYRKSRGDSNALRLEWDKAGIAGVRLDQADEIESDSFSALTSYYGNGAAWHETMEAIDPRVVRAYPGVQQEWTLKGFGGERGWLGSGLERGRFFLVFRAEPPIPHVPVTGPLRLGPSLFAFLDSSSLWLHVPCKDLPGSGSILAAAMPKGSPKPDCFSPGDDAHWTVRVDSRKPLRIQAWHEEGNSASLAEIRKAIGKVPDASQVEYAKDLSQMLLGEGQMFLVKLAQRLPPAFTWPSWQIQDYRGGEVGFGEFLPLVRRQKDPGEYLPAFRSEDPGLSMRVNLYYRGTVHLAAEGKP